MVQIARTRSPLPLPAPETAGAVSEQSRREPQAGATNCRQKGVEESALIPLRRAGDIDDLDGEGCIAAPPAHPQTESPKRLAQLRQRCLGIGTGGLYR